MEVRESRSWSARFEPPSAIVFVAGVGLLLASTVVDGVAALGWVGFPADRLHHPRVLADLAILRLVSGLLATVLVVSQIICWRYRDAGRAFFMKAEALRSAARGTAGFVPLVLIALVLAKTVLQLGLFVTGYTLYEGDDFARALKADYWVQHRQLDLGWELGYLALVGGGQLPFPDYLFGLGLALHRDLFFTPKIVNLLVSASAVIAAYFLGREVFGRLAGLLTAGLFAFLPWTVWLGISGMTSDLPSVVLITVFGACFFRWLHTGQTLALFMAAGALFLADGCRYENWLFSLAFSVVIVLRVGRPLVRRRSDLRTVSVAACALAIVNAFPVLWMVASYYTLGDWLPAFHKSVAFMVSPDTTAPRTSTISMPVLALGSFPFEVVAAITGVALCLQSDRRKPVRVYLLVLAATFLLFGEMFSWQLPSYGGIARYLLSFLALLLPFAALFMGRLLRTPETGWNQRAVLCSLVFLAVGAFDLMRAFNYPGTQFPKDALFAGWTLRGLQETGTIRNDAKILIERAEDWGDVSVVALANKPERFVLLNELAYRQTGLAGNLPNRRAPVVLSGNEGVRGDACDRGFWSEACRNSLDQEKFELVILSSPERVRSFQEAFRARSWNVGRYFIFDMRSGSGEGSALRP